MSIYIKEDLKRKLEDLTMLNNDFFGVLSGKKKGNDYLIDSFNVINTIEKTSLSGNYP